MTDIQQGLQQDDPWSGAPKWNPEGNYKGSDRKAVDQIQHEGRPVVEISKNLSPPEDIWSGAPKWNPSGNYDQNQTASLTTPERNIGAGEAAVRGAIDTASFGLAPALVGLQEAGKATPEGQQAEQAMTGVASESPGLESSGAGIAKLLEDYYGSHPHPEVRAAFENGRNSTLEENERAQKQQQMAFLAGQLGGAFLGPSFGAGGGATVAGRLGRGMLGGAIGGGLYTAGSDISSGTPAEDIPLDVVKGAAASATFGGVAGGGGALIGKAASKAASVYRGAQNVESEAGRRVAGALASDVKKFGPSATSEEIQAANQAGTPRALVDVGAERTRALARSAANTSPEARQALEEMTGQRFEQQAPRVAGFIRRLTGGADAHGDAEVLERAAKKANAPLYKRAYAAGDRPIWSPELEKLSSSPTVTDALRGAVSKWKDWQVIDGFGAANPPVKVTLDGQLKFLPGKGLLPYPNLQLWDYAARNLAGKAAEAARAGNKEAALRYGSLERAVKAELDKMVPEFKNARGMAASFFGANNALEAGQEFVMSNVSLPGARAAIAKMSAPERALFARGFASDFADKIERTQDRRNVLNSIFLANGPARQKVEMALGPDNARKLEALLRIEALIDKPRLALGNSSTVRQLGEHALAGGGAVAALEGIKEHEFNPSHILAGAFLLAAGKKGAQKIDEKVARRVGEMLASSDPAILQKGIEVLTRSPAMFNALRHATATGARVAAHDIGPENTLAGAITGGEAVFGGGAEEPPEESRQ